MISCSFPLVCLMTAIVLIDRSLSVVICFGAALMHELGHLIALRLCGSVPDRITLTLFDVAISDKDKAMRKRKQELFVTLAGVGVNFLAAAVGFGVFCWNHQESVMMFVSAHLTLGVFNSIPVSTLDGGQALLILLQHRMSPYRANRILDVLSLVILFPLAAAGFWVLLRSKYNFTLLAVSLYLIAVVLLKKQ